MKKILLLTIIFISAVNCLFGQMNPNVTRETYTISCPTKPLDSSATSKKIAINGHIYGLPKCKENLISFATVVIKGTKNHASADYNGFYSIDVTAIADTMSELIVYCAFPGYYTKEITLKHKITKTTEIDFELTTKPVCELPDIGDGKKNKARKKR